MSTWYGSLAQYLVPAAAVVMVAVAPVQGQEPLGQELERDRNCVCVDRLHEGQGWQAFTAARRAQLGVVLGEPAEVAGRNGVRLESVPDGSPAYRAGLRDDDIVVALNGQELGAEPTSRLLDLMEPAAPGDTVTATFFRDGSERTARVVTESTPGFGAQEGRLFRFRAPRPGGATVLRAPNAPRVASAARAARAEGLEAARLYRSLVGDGLELARVNAGLGEYFGTDRGVLVVEIDAESSLGLRTGDVILAIDGRDVQDPAHVRSILSSYREDEAIRFQIVRQEQTREVTGRRE